MITAKTESGFSIELEESTLDNMEVLDALSDLDEGNPLAMSRLVVKLLARTAKSACTTICAPRTAACLRPPLRAPSWSCSSPSTPEKTLHPRRTDRNGRGRTDLRFCTVLQRAELAQPAGAAGSHSGCRFAAGQPQRA